MKMPDIVCESKKFRCRQITLEMNALCFVAVMNENNVEIHKINSR